MEKAILAFKQFPNEHLEYVVIRTNDDIQMYIEQLKFETHLNTIKRKRGSHKHHDGISEVVRFQKLINGYAISDDSVILLKEKRLREMLVGGCIYINSNGGMFAHNDNVVIIKTWYEQKENI
jgi:hypothetical protein